MPLSFNPKVDGSADILLNDNIVVTIDNTGIVSFPNNPVESEKRIGVGQTWQNVTASRSPSITYFNNTGRPIGLSFTGVATASGAAASLEINGETILIYGGSTTPNGVRLPLTTIIPNGASYRIVLTSTSIANWHELR